MLTGILTFVGCAKSTKNLEPVTEFELERYRRYSSLASPTASSAA
ncbi:MAG: hypothetical protein U5N86_10855 [Planctomycetota bacterium]|nr:hypothetical protein [Planctomycetota bacterium]